MFKAISKAGFNTTDLPTLKDIMMVSEPEAAALFTAQDLKDRGTDFLQVSSHVFITFGTCNSNCCRKNTASSYATLVAVQWMP